MAGDIRKILVVEPDARIVEVMVDSLVRRFGAQITCVSHGRDALDIEMLEPQDVVVASCDAPDMPCTTLAEQLTAVSRRPVIMTAQMIESDEVITLLRFGVRDVLVKPFPVGDLLQAVECGIESHRLHREHQIRHRQLRELTRRLVRERREMSQRMDLICRDLVGAHRRLVSRVLEVEDRIGQN